MCLVPRTSYHDLSLMLRPIAYSKKIARLCYINCPKPAQIAAEEQVTASSWSTAQHRVAIDERMKAKNGMTGKEKGTANSAMAVKQSAATGEAMFVVEAAPFVQAATVVHVGILGLGHFPLLGTFRRIYSGWASSPN